MKTGHSRKRLFDASLNRKWGGTVLLLCCLSLCCEETAAPVVESPWVFRPPYAWPTSTPVAQGMDTAATSLALQELRSSPWVLSYLVVRNDSLVVEYYRNGLTELNDYDLYSASKSINSALIGLAIHRGFIRSVNDKVLDYFPDFDTTNLDPRKRLWTIEHFLTMRAGFDWVEQTDHSSQFPPGSNWVHAALGLPLKNNPGEAFTYASPCSNILSALLAAAAKQSTYDFAEEQLFTPLKISVRYWYQDPQKVYAGGAGMVFTPRDMARFGQLYLHEGMIEGKEILPRSWILQTITPHNTTPYQWGSFQNVNYGYEWWTNFDGPDSVYFAAGYGGQFIFIVPSRNMVIVSGTDASTSIQEASRNEAALIILTERYFLHR